MRCILFCISALITTFAHAQTNTAKSMQLLEKIKATLAQEKGVYAMAFIDLQTKDQLMLNEHENFHAASTMKTPVMIEVFKQQAAGKLSLQQMVTVKNEFKSIVDSSVYSLNASDDSQQELYKKVGTQLPLSELVYQMIILSSNLATNLIIDMVDGKNVTQTMRSLGANDIQVLRGVEDSKAFAKGLNNTTTAYDLAIIFSKMAEGKIVSKTACDEMIRILLDQQHNTVIPALLPKEVKVAHKTGSIAGVHHDSGIIYLPDGRKYVLVLLSKNLESDTAATTAMAKVSEMVYRYVSERQ
jgi:beta-lactamase class A